MPSTAARRTVLEALGGPEGARRPPSPAVQGAGASQGSVAEKAFEAVPRSPGHWRQSMLNLAGARHAPCQAEGLWKLPGFEPVRCRRLVARCLVAAWPGLAAWSGSRLTFAGIARRCALLRDPRRRRGPTPRDARRGLRLDRNSRGGRVARVCGDFPEWRVTVCDSGQSRILVGTRQ